MPVLKQRRLAVAFGVLGLMQLQFAEAQQRSCRQLGPVAGSPLPDMGASANVALVVGDHYWSCPCGETRKFVGDNENRALVGDNEHRALVGDTEHRALVGDNEQRRMVGDNEQRRLVGDNEQRRLVGDQENRALVGDNEQRRLVGDAGGLQCRPDPQCGGFVLLGSSVAVQVVTRGGLRPANASCVQAY